MKKIFIPIIVTVALITWSLAVAPAAFSMDEPGFTVARMVVSEDVVDREPVGTGELFSTSHEKVYCFLEANDIEQDKEVNFVWYYDDTEIARVMLTLRQGSRWRTYSSKNLVGQKGAWKVELQDDSGIVHNSVSFTVE